MSPTPLAFAAACIVMAAGIGIDVALATIGRFRAIRSLSDGLGWAARITATHIAFPMIGYYGFVFAARTMATLAPYLGLAAGAMVFWFLKDAVSGWLEHPEEDEPPAAGFTWAAVIAVSIDALWSGPAKSAQVIGWPPLPIAISFPVSGLLVGVIALIALAIALWLKRAIARAAGPSPARLAAAESLGQGLEFCVLAYFGLLALARYTAGLEVSAVAVFGAAALITSAVFIVIGRRVHAANLAAARHLLEPASAAD
ncbi:MAG: hypothetical protein R3D02_16160 [Hyphomicrobiales bacterium]